MRRVLMTFVFVQFFQYLFSDCIVGETWYEKCRKCKCNINQKPKCEVHSCNSIAVCPSKMIWMSDEQRCYCDRPLQHSVCVDIEFQKDMRGHACDQDTFFYDSCTLCICQGGRTACVAYSNCFNPRGGICNEGDSIIDNCFNCTCTHTRFLKCVLIEKCWSRENKEGKCPTRKNMLFDLGCIIGIDQECHYDYECPDEKKCCQVTECSFRCQKPVIDN
ncbi:uncharacterized protein LOC123682074 isoform X1 [Harmonia axyridis]|uniref:uncharacterized protein LOC123682074 isoform X1 n=1 Tax=Harmonia axyridis TaxID=115357 RepID=UPI001E277DF7|nr:uncharacterized protein LOC123682074 isoform X1 [Harmonia axyridis]